MVVAAGEVMVALLLELAGVLSAQSLMFVVVAAAVLEAGVNEGVVAVHLGQIVTVSVVMKVEYAVMT